MDKKLSKGYAREFFRNDIKVAGKSQQSLADIHEPYIRKLFKNRRLDKKDIEDVIGLLMDFLHNPVYLIFIEVFAKPQSKSVSKRLDKVLVGGNISSDEITIFGNKEKVRIYSQFYDKYSNKRIDLRTLDLPIYIREHAISRFIERTDSKASSIAGTLWPGILLIDAFEIFSPLQIAHSFAIPTATGMFLGVAASGISPLIQGIQRTVINAEGQVQESENAGHANHISTLWFLNSFISLSEMSSAQKEISKLLSLFVEKHKSVLLRAHLDKIMSVDDEGDDMGLKERYSGNFEKAKDSFTCLIDGQLWLDAVRDPQKSVFEQHFLGQAVLEKQGKRLN